MAELNQSFHLSPQFCRSEEEITRLIQDFTLRDENSRPQQPIAPPSTNYYRASPSFSSSPYSLYQNNYLMNSFRTESSYINGGFPSQCRNSGGFSPQPQLWNTTGDNAVDWSYVDNSCRYVNPYALPSIGNYERVARINSPVSSWNDYSYPSTRINSAVPTSSNTSCSSTTVSTMQKMKKEKLEYYNERKTSEFKDYLKLKGWMEEDIQSFEWCDDPILLDDYYGLDIHIMCMNKLGCQYLQRDRVMKSAPGIILDSVLKGIFQIMSDPNGNCVFQRLVSKCSPEQLQKIVYALTKRDASMVFIKATMTENGTRSMQYLIGRLRKHPLIKNVINSLKPWVLELMMNPWGRHLIDQCINVLNYDKCQFIYSAVKQNCLDLARHKEGYHVVSKAIETIQDPLRMELLMLITDNAVHLAQEPNGNFVIQKVINLENPKIISKLCINLEEKIVPLSKTQYGSRVIETCLKSSAVDSVAKEILNSKKLIELAQNEFGNYVLQKALKNLKDKRRHKLYVELVDALRALSKSLENHPRGKMVLKCMGELEIQAPKCIFIK